MMMDLPSSDQAFSEGPALYQLLEIILRGGVNQYYQINNSISQTDLYTLLQLSELACTRDCT